MAIAPSWIPYSKEKEMTYITVTVLEFLKNIQDLGISCKFLSSC